MATTASWQDWFAAIAFIEDRLRLWQKEGKIHLNQMPALDELYAKRRDWGHQAEARKVPFPDIASLPPGRKNETAWQKSLRYETFLKAELRELLDAGHLTLAQAHSLEAEGRERIASLERRIDREIPLVEPVGPVAVPRPRLNFMELILDPRSIQWLLAFGGGLMIIGLVILLWVNKYFTPPVLAATLGLVNTALLVGGWGLIRRTRYQVAGRALTLLACLAMPLNLWYYHTHDLLTIDGHLWVAALVISVLYLASALVLRDELFVYVFVGGVALTGLLILADVPPSPAKFWEIASPSALLVVLGLLSLHVERAFPVQDGPFSRKRFGMAFFWSGHAALAAGLLLILGAQIAADWLYEPIFKSFYDSWHAGRTPIVTEQWGQMLALCLVLAGLYAYLYSDVVVRRIGVYLYLAAGMLLWAEVLGIELLHLRFGMDFLIAVLAATGIVVNLVSSLAGRRDSSMVRTLPVLGLILGLAPVALGLIAYLRAVNFEFEITWTYVGAMALTAVACRYGAYLARSKEPNLLLTYFFGAAAATLVAALAFFVVVGLSQWQQHAPWLMLLPLAYLAAARLYRDQPEERALYAVADAAAIVMLVSSLASAFEGFTTTGERPLNLMLAVFFAEAAIYFGLAAGLRKKTAAIHASAGAACAAVWQLLSYLGVQSETYTLTFAVVGLLLLVAYRFAVLERFAVRKLADATFQSANVLLSLSFTAAVFMGLSRLAEQHVDWRFLILCIVLGLISLAAVALVREAAWRRWYVVTTISQALLTFLTIQVLSTLSLGQKLEIFSVASGLALLIVGHIGWYREHDRHNDLVGLALFLGSLLAGTPLLIATLVDRWRGQFLILDEMGFFCVSVLLLATGFIFRLRATTLTGSLFTIAYFVLLLLFVPWRELNSVAVIITVGGGVLFGTGLLLSVYRDRLLTLPDRIKKREGIYRVLSWR
jgi:hypothetical protein